MAKLVTRNPVQHPEIPTRADELQEASTNTLDHLGLKSPEGAVIYGESPLQFGQWRLGIHPKHGVYMRRQATSYPPTKSKTFILGEVLCLYGIFDIYERLLADPEISREEMLLITDVLYQLYQFNTPNVPSLKEAYADFAERNAGWRNR